MVWLKEKKSNFVIKRVYQIIKLTQLGAALLNFSVAQNKVFNTKHGKKSAMP